ncbi:MAG: ABC transporter ATP-binding protein [Thermofilaceae archaeon]
MVRIELVDVYKAYHGGKVVAANVPYLKIEDGEFFGLLGPSGSGKTTTLRIIAGLTEPDKGRVLFDGEDVTRVPPEKRNLGMVFQSWALFPHLTVFENIAFGLRLRKLPESEISRRVKWASELLRIEELLYRYPYQLSGGQQQRVAVARAIVIEPRALLFDEPLSNLDAKLRDQVRFELRKLQRELKITSIYVTHDQAEAFVLCDRVAVMNKGNIEQLGKPEEIYNSPATPFVAEFMGVTTLIPAAVSRVADYNLGLAVVKLEDTDIELVARTNLEKVSSGSKVLLVVRPESLKLASPSDKTNVLRARVVAGSYLGDHMEYLLLIDNYTVRMRTSIDTRIQSNSEVYIKIEENNLYAIPI